MKSAYGRRMTPAVILLSCLFLFINVLSGCRLLEGSSRESASGPPLEPGISQPEEAPPSNEHRIPITYYNQSDPAWASYLYGGYDSMAAYGCGPAALAIVVASLNGNGVTPVDTAIWSVQNGCYAKGSGSAHQLIPNGAAAYGLTVENMSVLTPEALRNAISFDKLLVLLMGPGDFSDTGHFIVAYGYNEDGNIMIADPASEERSLRPWPPETLLLQLSKTPQAAGPVWALSN